MRLKKATASQVDSKGEKLLLITSSGGGGHIQAAKAKAAEALSENPNTIIIQKDIMTDCLGKHVGKRIAHLWNFSQKKGYLPLLSFLSKNIPTADFIFYPYIFSRMLFTIIREDIDRIIDTQPIGTAAIIKAIKWAHKITQKELKLEKIVTELPTDKTVHFFKSIKALSAKDHSFIKLISTTPLLHKNQTADAFWKKHCGLSEKEISYESFPLRLTFGKYAQTPCLVRGPITIEIKVGGEEEKFLICNTMKRGNLHVEIHSNTIVIPIESEDKVSTILLGSHPAEKATFNYVKSYIKMMKWASSQERHLLFVFCNHHTPQKNTLLRWLHDLVEKTSCYPDQLNIIPMCFQDDRVIAPLYHRSNATFTRSGGLTSMELMLVAQGQIWIHSEAKQGVYNKKKLAKGMPIWEQGNAIYLQEKKGAQFITPDTFSEACTPYFL